MTAHLDGVPLVRAVAMTALRSHSIVVTVVTGQDREGVEAALGGLDLHVVHNARFESGIASSLLAGLAALPNDIDGILVMLGDMPCVRTGTLDTLISRFHDTADAVVPIFRGERGNPVLLGSRLFPALRLLRGDHGARHLLSAPDLTVDCCEVDDPGIAIDIDTQEALNALKATIDRR